MASLTVLQMCDATGVATIRTYTTYPWIDPQNHSVDNLMLLCELILNRRRKLDALSRFMPTPELAARIEQVQDDLADYEIRVKQLLGEELL